MPVTISNVAISNVTISKWGNSAALRLPKKLLKQSALQIGDKVNLVQQGRTVVIEPCSPSLDEMLGQTTDDNHHPEFFTDKQGDELL